MKTKISASKYKLLVLIDLAQVAPEVLQYAINLSKLIDGSIELFYVKTPTEIVKNDNQSSAIIAIEKERSSIKKQMEKLTERIAKEENISIKYDFTFGNIKNEVLDHLNSKQPDIVVLGKGKPKLLSFFSDNLTQFVINNFGGNVLITGKTNTPYTDMLLGFFDEHSNQDNFEITQDLKQLSTSPIINFKFKNKEATTSTKPEGDKESITFEFEETANTLSGLSSYVLKSNVELLCLVRNTKKNRTSLLINNISSNIKQLLNKTSVPVLILGH